MVLRKETEAMITVLGCCKTVQAVDGATTVADKHRGRRHIQSNKQRVCIVSYTVPTLYHQF